MGDILGPIIGGISDVGKTVATAVLTKSQRKWLEKMRKTAHQTEVQDLIVAGLNPVLSAGGGPGAPIPSGLDMAAPADALPEGKDVSFMIQQSLTSAKQRALLDQEIKTEAARAKSAELGYQFDVENYGMRSKSLEVGVREGLSRIGQSNANATLLGTENILRRAGVPRAQFQERLLGDMFRAGGELYDWVKKAIPGFDEEGRNSARE